MESGFCLNFKHRCEVVFGGTHGVHFYNVVFSKFAKLILRDTHGVRFLSDNNSRFETPSQTFETQLLKPVTDITLRSLSLPPSEDMLTVGGADDMHGLLLQLSPDMTHILGANEQSVLWLAKDNVCDLKIPLGAAATVTPAWTGPWLRLNLGPA